MILVLSALILNGQGFGAFVFYVFFVAFGAVPLGRMIIDAGNEKARWLAGPPHGRHPAALLRSWRIETIVPQVQASGNAARRFR